MMDHPVCKVKCIFCGLCVNESCLNEHMKVYHKIKTLHLKPQQKEASTQIAEEDRHFIYPRKRKLVDMKFLTSTPKKSKLDKSDISLPSFNEQYASVEFVPKIEPNNYCNEVSKEIPNLNPANLILRFKCPSCDEHSSTCEQVLVHIENIHSGDSQDVRPVKQRMRLQLRKVKIAKQKLYSQVEYYRKYGGLYLHTGVRGDYQCVLKSVHNIRDIKNIKSGSNKNNIPIQDYSVYSFQSLKDFNNELEEDISISNSEMEVCIFCKKMFTKGTLEDHIKREHNINDSLAISTLINMTSDNDVNKDPVNDAADMLEIKKANEFYVTDEIVTDKEDEQSITLPTPQHNHCCSANDSKLNMKFECNWCMKTYNCRFHRNFHENKCNLTYELEKQDPGNADEISLSVFGVRFRCPLSDYHSDKRKDVRDHIVDFHQGYSKRSGQFVELHPIRQEMRILMSRRPMQKVTQKHSKPKDVKKKPLQTNNQLKSSGCRSGYIKEHLNDQSTKQTCQLKVNKQLTDEIKAEFNDLERELLGENNVINDNEVSIEVNNDVNDEVKDEIHSDMNNGYISQNDAEEGQSNEEIVGIMEQPVKEIIELNTICLQPDEIIRTDEANKDIIEEREVIVHSDQDVAEVNDQSNNDGNIQKEILSKNFKTKSDPSTNCLLEKKVKEAVEEFDGIILEQVDEKDKSDVELTENELHYILESCQLSAGEQNTLSLAVEQAQDEKDATSSLLSSFLPSWRPWSASPPGSRQEVTEGVEDHDDGQKSEKNEIVEKTTNDSCEVIRKGLKTESIYVESNINNFPPDNTKPDVDMSVKSSESKQAELIGLVEAAPAHVSKEMFETKEPIEKPTFSNHGGQLINKANIDQDQSNSEFEEDNMSVASFNSIKSKARSKYKITIENSDSIVSNSEYEEDNMSVASFHSIKDKAKTKSNAIHENIESDKVVSNSAFDEDPSDENMFRSESQSSDCDSSIKLVSPARKAPLSDLQNVPGPSRPCQCPFCPTKFDTAKQISAHIAECKGRLRKGDESDDTGSTTTTMAESETSMRPPALDWAVSPRSIKTSKMSDIKSNVTNVYIRFVQTYYSSYKRRFPDLSSADLMQKLCEGYRILRATNHQSVRTLQMEYEKERKAKFSDKIRTIVRGLEEDGCAYFNTSLGSGQAYPCNRLTP